MDARELFAGLLPPRAPEGLKERVLRAAREMPTATPERYDVIDRIWQSRKWRWGWAATVAALAVAHLLLLREQSGPSRVADDGARAMFEPIVLDLASGLVDPTLATTWIDQGRPTLREIAQDPAQGP